MSANPKRKPGSLKSSTDSGNGDLYLPPYLNRSLLIVVLIFAAIGTIVALPQLLSERTAQGAMATHVLVVIPLLAIALLSVAALLHQQRFVVSSHERYEQARAETLARVQRSMNRLYAMLDVSRMVGTVSDLQTMLDRITDACGKNFTCHMASLMLYDEDTSELVVRSVGGPHARQQALDDRQKLGEGVAGWAAKRRQPLLLPRNCNLRDYPDLELKSKVVTAAMVVPIVVDDRLFGVLNVSTRSRDVDFTEEDFRAVQLFAASVGNHIRCTLQVERMKKTTASVN